MKVLFITIILFLALFLETTFFSLPLVLLAILLLGVIWKEAWIFPVAFAIGIILDMLSFHTVGQSSIFFVFMLGVVYLYQRKFEIQTVPFILVATLIASSLYFFFFGSTAGISQVLLSVALSIGIFFLFQNMVGSTSSRRKI